MELKYKTESYIRSKEKSAFSLKGKRVYISSFVGLTVFVKLLNSVILVGK